MCYSWGIHRHISCGCILVTFHIFDKHDFTTKLQLTKTDLKFKRLACIFLQNRSLCNIQRVVCCCFFLHNWQAGILFLFRSLLTQNFPLHFQFLCFPFHYVLWFYQFKSNWASWSLTPSQTFPTKQGTFCLWEQHCFVNNKEGVCFGQGMLTFLLE